MNIFVIMKRTFDTEEKIEIHNGQVEEDGVEFIINPYDEYAIEESIVLRDEHGGEVTVVTVGEEDADKELRTALAMGVDKAVLLNTEDIDGEMDSFTVAKILTTYLKSQEYDIILGGNVAVDDGAAQVAARVAEGLGINQLTTITDLKVDGSHVHIERDIEGDVELNETTLPLLVTCQQGLNEPRYPSLPGIMKAKKKPLDIIDVDDLGIDEDDVEAKTSTLDIFLPPEKKAGKILEGEKEAQVKELVSLLHTEAKVLSL